jgi:thiol-disulfide isomerase/thioredoxin
MKLKLTPLLFLFGILLNGCSDSDLKVLSKTNKKLQNFKSVQYDYDYKNYNLFTGELGQNESLTAIFDFTSKDTIIGTRYHLSRNYGEIGFNGLTSFYTIREKKQLIYYPVRSKDNLIGYTSILIYSVEQLRDLLPQMLNDTAIVLNRMADTVINQTACIGFDIVMHGKKIDWYGKIVQGEKAMYNYALFIDKKDFLPKQFIQYWEKKSPVWVIMYNNIKSLEAVHDSIFDYPLQKSDYTKYTEDEYQVVSRNEYILKGNSWLGVKALDWTLPSMAGDSVTLSKIDANLVMLEFWFPYCTGCVKAIPEINEIQKKYKNKGLKVYGIEFTKSDSTNLTSYISKMKIEYPTLYAAKKVALGYGVTAGPSVFLIKEGKFVFARTGFIKNELLNEIKKYVK